MKNVFSHQDHRHHHQVHHQDQLQHINKLHHLYCHQHWPVLEYPRPLHLEVTVSPLFYYIMYVTLIIKTRLSQGVTSCTYTHDQTANNLSNWQAAIRCWIHFQSLASLKLIRWRKIQSKIMLTTVCGPVLRLLPSHVFFKIKFSDISAKDYTNSW